MCSPFVCSHSIRNCWLDSTNLIPREFCSTWTIRMYSTCRNTGIHSQLLHSCSYSICQSKYFLFRVHHQWFDQSRSSTCCHFYANHTTCSHFSLRTIHRIPPHSSCLQNPHAALSRSTWSSILRSIAPLRYFFCTRDHCVKTLALVMVAVVESCRRHGCCRCWYGKWRHDGIVFH